MINVFCGKEAVGTCEHTAVLIFSRDRGYIIQENLHVLCHILPQNSYVYNYISAGITLCFLLRTLKYLVINFTREIQNSAKYLYFQFRM